MKKSKLPPTLDQIRFRSQILKSRQGAMRHQKCKDRRELELKHEFSKTIEYIENCGWWINEYKNGRISIERLRITAISLQENGRQLQSLIESNPTIFNK